MSEDLKLKVILKVVIVQLLLGKTLDAAESNVFQIWAAPGSSTKLPCDLAASTRDVGMVMWFKGADRMPIYTVDFRNGAPIHWAVTGEVDSRSHFALNESDPSSAHLVLENVRREDEAVYRCRVDYVDSPTKNYKLNLTVVVAPSAPRLYDMEGREILGSVAGPFREGQDLLLSCQALGGKPLPNVSWYRGDERLVRTRKGSVSQLHIPSLSREMSGTKLQCRIDSPLLTPQVKEITLKLYLKPQLVRLSGQGAAKAGHERSFVCTTRGSKPAPNIDWFINSQKIDSTLTQVEVDGDVTKSILTWRIRREDSGRSLLCRVSNPWFPAHTLEDSVILDVLYPPVAQISLVVPKESRLLREDEDAELLCSSDANPPAKNFSFYKEVNIALKTFSYIWPIGENLQLNINVPKNKQVLFINKLQSINTYNRSVNIGSGDWVLHSGHSSAGQMEHLIREDPIGGISTEGATLVLRNLRRHHSARYRCRARNSEGSALSEPLAINILSRPECAAGSVVQQLAGTPGGEVRARCSVSAPLSRDAGPLRFYWTYNSTRDVLPIPASNVTVLGSSSTVVHGLPDDVDDLGWLACWASNDVGNQREPCLYRIVTAALPEPPTNCEVNENGLTLHCSPGHDGGLPQHFVLEVLEVRPTEPVPEDNEISTMNDQDVSNRGTSEAVYKASNEAPRFSLDALSPGRYTLLVFAETPRGRSQRAATLHSVAIRSMDIDKPDSLLTMTPAPPPATSNDGVALLVGSALSLVLLTLLTTLCVSMVIMCRRKRRSTPEPDHVISRRNVGVSMYSGTNLGPSVMPTVVVRGHRTSRVLAARWSGILDEAPLAVLAIDGYPHDTSPSISEGELQQETELRRLDDMETQTD